MQLHEYSSVLCTNFQKYNYTFQVGCHILVNQNVVNSWSRTYCASPWEYSGEDTTHEPCPDGDFYKLIENTDIEEMIVNN